MLLQKTLKTITTRIYAPSISSLNVTKFFFSRGYTRPYTIKRPCNDTLGSSARSSLSTITLNWKFMSVPHSSAVSACQISNVRNYSDFRSLQQHLKNHRGRSLRGEDWKSTALAIGGATLTFLLLPPLLLFVLNGAKDEQRTGPSR